MTELVTHALTHFAACTNAGQGIRILPTWYQYLPLRTDSTGRCSVNFDAAPFPENIPLIGLGIVDILLRLAAFVAIGYLIYGGIQYILSQGEPDKITGARQAITNALIGLVLALLATAIVTFIGNRLA